MKSIRNYFSVLVLAIAFICPAILFTGCGPAPVVAKVTFDGTGEVQELKKADENILAIPTYTLDDGVSVIGWATTEGATVPEILAAGTGYQNTEITYAIVENYLNNKNEVTLYKVLQGENIVVTFSTIVGTNGTATLNALTKNSVTVPTPTLGAKQEFIGWATIDAATEAQITASASIKYADVKTMANEGALTLYPVIKTYDLTVAVWGQNGKSNTYATEEQITTLKGKFDTHLQSLSLTKNVKYTRVEGSSDSSKASYYPTQVPEDTMIILGGQNVVTQCGSVGKYEVSTLIVNFESTRYASVYSDYVNDELVNLFIDYACAANVVKVTLVPGQNDIITYVSDVRGNDANIIVTPPQNNVFVGWARTQNATEAEIFSTATLNYATVSPLANDGQIVLYPVFEESKDLSVTFKCDTDCPVTLNNISKNVAELTTITLTAGQEVKGWSISSSPTIEMLTSSPETTFGAGLTLDYEHLLPYANQGALTLYPIIGTHYDLVVSVYGVAAKSTTIYMTEEQLNNIKDGFKTYYTKNKQAEDPDFDSLSIKWIRFTGGKEAEYEAQVTLTNSNNQIDGVDLTISRTVLKSSNTQVYSEEYPGVVISAGIQVEDTSDVGTGIIVGHENKFAIMLYTYLTTAQPE